MRNIIFIFLIMLSNFFGFAQRTSYIRNGVDTNNLVFKEIYQFWESYQNDLFKKLIIGDTTVNTNKYWSNTEIQENKSPDIILKSPSIYYLLPEYLIGIEKRNDTLYEINSVYFSNYSKNPEISTNFSVFVANTKEGYKLYNAFTINKTQFQEKKWEWLYFYYPNNYEFNEENAEAIVNRAQILAKLFELKEIKPIKYFLFTTYTEMLNSLGIHIQIDDYNSINDLRKRGFALFDSRQIFYTKEGEKLLHEIIHIMIYDLRGNNNGFNFDEGVCSYFGDHQEHPFPFHAHRLKIFLNQNPQIDLGINLTEAYLDDKQNYSHDIKWKEEPYGTTTLYFDDTTNFMYIIMGTICELAYKKGGINLVKKMIFEAQNDDKMYKVIENNLDIKQSEINEYLRAYLNENY